MFYTDEDRAMMMRTERAAGAVGANAVLPRVVEALVEKHWSVLDYGSGPKALATMALRDKGYNVMAHDINPEKTMWHIDDKLHFYSDWFDVVFASNVLNVQPTEECIRFTIWDVHQHVTRYGGALFNYPASPRKSGLSVADINGILKEQFMDVERVTMIGDWRITTPVWKCKKGG